MAVRGYLVVTVAEASGRNKDEEEVWDPSFYEGFVKGGQRSRSEVMTVCRTVHCGTNVQPAVANIGAPQHLLYK